MLNDDRMDINNRFENLRELEKEIKNREFEIEKSKEELMALDKEIREWESTHWRLRKGTRPPSAI